MPLWIIMIILGVVEGITEFLPVSSTGHLILTSHLLGFQGEIAGTFEIAIQGGAILAVVCIYKTDFFHLFFPVQEKRFSGWNACVCLLLTTLPALCLGYMLRDSIKTYLFHPVSVTLALLLGGSSLVVLERIKLPQNKESLDEISFRMAFLIGWWQCIAMWPGMSRSAATIIGGIALGLDRKTAAKYSFLAAVPVLLAATIYEIYCSFSLLTAEYFALLALGMLVSFGVAVLAIKAFLKIIGRYTLAPFGYYRIGLSVLFFSFLYFYD